MADQIITQEYLREIFDYKDGELYWKKRISIRITVGKKAGSFDKRDRIFVRINKKLIALHRVIFAYHFGFFPKLIDHIDQNPLNNRIENLRPATVSQNACNSKIPSNNTSGIKGVYWHKKAKKWHARLKFEKKLVAHKLFDKLKDAEVYIKKMREIYHGEFASHG